MIFSGERYLPSYLRLDIALEHWHRYNFAAKFCENKEVLDVACGVGYGSHLISRYAKQVIGIDNSLESVEFAKSHYQVGNISFIQSHAEYLPFASKIFNSVLSFETIEHLDYENQKVFLREIRRLIVDNGIFIVSTPDKNIYSDSRNYSNPFHKHEFTSYEFVEFLSQEFQFVRLFGQKTLTASHISPFEVFQDSSQLHYARLYDNEVQLPVPSPKYLIALCSQIPLPEFNTSILLDQTNTFDLNTLLSRAHKTLEVNDFKGDLHIDSRR